MNTKFLMVIGTLVSAVLAAGPGKERAYHAHEGLRDLSEEEHYTGGGHEHNVQYDHEAFLGKEEAMKFDQLSEEDARRQLGLLVDEIDKNGDGSVTEDELKDWVTYVSRRYIRDDVDRLWDHYDKDNDSFTTLDEIKDTMFGKVEDKERIYDRHRQLTYNQAITRCEKRFKAADRDGDGKLNRDDFADFFHPAEVKHMQSILVEERMEEMDRNKDGKVILEEYIGDIWHSEEGTEEPDWVKRERENFSKHRDKDKDGWLSKEEVVYMIAPPGYDPHLAETKHLIYEADTNKDKVLTKEEILAHQDLFVGSRATDYGNYVMKHDEF